MKIFLTGCVGFIGFHTSLKLMKKGHKIVGVDEINDYYDVKLKKNRLKILEKQKNFKFFKLNICNKKKLYDCFKKNKCEIIINLAAQAGVRYSIKFPEKYLNSNIIGFFNILDLSVKFKIKHLLFASTSSVYGKSKKFPLKESYDSNQPISFYSATKVSNEVMAYSYSYIHKLPCTCLRFFTVYGPYGRPDMALFKFTSAILKNKKINFFNNGSHIRDFTYIDDVVIMIEKLLKKSPKNNIPYDTFNLSNSKPIALKSYLKQIEINLGIKAKLNLMPLQKGDVFKTHASNRKLINKIGRIKPTPIDFGIKKFIEWYKTYHA
jgi:UDP-glucuronate 4-epimerase